MLSCLRFRLRLMFEPSERKQKCIPLSLGSDNNLVTHADRMQHSICTGHGLNKSAVAYSVVQFCRPPKQRRENQGSGGRVKWPQEIFLGSNMVFWNPRFFHLATILAPICLNCTKFGQLVHRKIIKTVAHRCHILRLKCIKYTVSAGAPPQTPLGALTALSQTP